VAVFPDAADTAKEVVQSEGLGISALGGVPFEKLKISGTPTLLLVDRSGTVLKRLANVPTPAGPTPLQLSDGAATESEAAD